MTSRIEKQPDFNVPISGQKKAPLPFANNTGGPGISIKSDQFSTQPQFSVPESISRISAQYQDSQKQKLGQVYKRLENDLSQLEQGWLGSTWDCIKNNLGCSGEGKAWYDPRKWWSCVVSSDNGSESTQSSIADLRKKLSELKQFAESGNEEAFSKRFQEITGKGLDASTSGENLLGGTKQAERIKAYAESQQTGVDVISDIASGIVSFACYTVAAAALVAAPFTGGSSLIITAGALACASGAGALTKVAVKASDAWSGGRSYDSFGYDAATGAFSGLLAPLTAGAGSAVTGSIAKRLGLAVVSQTVGRGLTTEISIQGGRLLTRAGVRTLQMSFEGACAGGVDNTFRHVVKTGSFEGASEAFAQGTLGGLILSPVIGGSLRAVSHGVSALRGPRVQLPEDILSSTAFKAAQRKGSLHIDIDHALEEGIEARTIIEVNPNGTRTARIAVSKDVAGALADINHPDHIRAREIFNEELIHANQRIRPSDISEAEYTARGARDELKAKRASKENLSDAERISRTQAIHEINEHIKAGRFDEAIALAKQHGVTDADIATYIDDHRGGGVVQRANRAYVKPTTLYDVAVKIEDTLAEQLLKEEDNTLLALLSELKKTSGRLVPAAQKAGIDPAFAKHKLLTFLTKHNRLDLVDSVNNSVDAYLHRIRTGDPYAREIRSLNAPSLEEVVFALDEQLKLFRPHEIQTIIDSFPPELRGQALLIFKQMTQFGNMHSINDICRAIDEVCNKPGSKTNFRICTEGKGMLADVIAYLRKKGNYVNVTSSEASLPSIHTLDNLLKIKPEFGKDIALILDDALLARLEKDQRLVQHLLDLQKEGCTVKLISPDGWSAGVNPFNHTSNFRDRIASIMDRAKEIKLQTKGIISDEQAISEAMMESVRNKLEKLGLAKNLEIIQNQRVLSTEASVDGIASQLNPPRLDLNQLSKIINEKKMRLPLEAQKAVIEFIARDPHSFSPRSLAIAAEDLNRRILQHANSKLIPHDKIFYLIPEGSLEPHSYSISTMQYCATNKISPSQVITRIDQLPVNPQGHKSMIVVLDDVAATGDTLNKVYGSIRRLGYEGEVVIAPTISTPTASKVFMKNIANDASLAYLPHREITPFTQSTYFKSLSLADQRAFLDLMGSMGYGRPEQRAGLSVVFPSMAPNIDNEFFSRYIAPFFTLNGSGAKNVTKYETRQKMAAKAINSELPTYRIKNSNTTRTVTKSLSRVPNSSVQKDLVAI